MRERDMKEGRDGEKGREERRGRMAWWMGWRKPLYLR